MRDLMILGIVMYGLFRTLSTPYIGVYLWSWISLMSPHLLTWGFASTFPFAMLIAGGTLLGLITGKQAKLKIWSPESGVLLTLIIWVCITTIFAVDQEGALKELDRYLKIQLFIFLTLALMSDRQKLDGFIWVMVISLGFYGVKGGIFTALTGGGARVWGPDGSFIGGNNEVALALIMTVPLMRYLQLQSENKWIKRGLLAAILLSAAAILGTQSRGAFLGIMAIGAFFWVKSPRKVESSIMVGIVAAVVLLFMPQTWWDRMNTIQTYDQDASAMGRVNAWWVAWRTANSSLTGGGANMFTPEMFQKYAPDPLDVHDVHSIYFEMLGEQGWIGFCLFVTLGILVWRRCGLIIKTCKNDPAQKWAVDLALMLQVSLIGYATAGAFLGLSYYDYYYDLIATALITWRLVNKNTEVGLAPTRAKLIKRQHQY